MLAEEILDKLKILPLDSLKIHEQTIEPNFRALRETMLNLGRIVDPIIVDSQHHVVLDGNHRRQVLEDLKCEHAVCQVVDYMDPSIGIGGWYLAAKGSEIAKKYGLGGEKVDLSEGRAALERMEACAMLVEGTAGSNDCRIFPSLERNLHSVLAGQRELFGKITANPGDVPNNGSLMFIEDVRSHLFLEKGYSVFERRAYKKEEVIAEAIAGRPLPPKSTRHMIPNRIIRLNFHLGYLNETQERAEQILTEIVRKRVKYGSARYYTEPVIVMY